MDTNKKTYPPPLLRAARLKMVRKCCHGNMEDPVAKKCHGNMEDPVAKKWGANTPHQTTTTEHTGGIGNIVRWLLRQTCCGKFTMVLHGRAAVLCGEWSVLASRRVERTKPWKIIPQLSGLASKSRRILHFLTLINMRLTSQHLSLTFTFCGISIGSSRDCATYWRSFVRRKVMCTNVFLSAASKSPESHHWEKTNHCSNEQKDLTILWSLNSNDGKQYGPMFQDNMPG